ncbi:MAG TPA: TadE/TadG family type IV pilus assembly protein [Terracidiphilus sp.]
MKIQTNSHGQAMTLKRRLNCAKRSLELRVELRPFGRWVRAILRKGEEGSAIVEIALVTPILMGLLTAICTFAIGFNNQLTLNAAVGQGANYLQTLAANATDPCAQTLTAIENAAPSLKASSIKLTIAINGTTVSQTSNSCTGAASTLAAAANDPVTVSATYPCVLTIMPLGHGTNFISKCQLSASETVYEY